MMKLSAFDEQILHEARAERNRLRALVNELSNEALARAFKCTINHVKAVLSDGKRKKNNRMSMMRAQEIAEMIKNSGTEKSLFRVGLRWGLVDTSQLTDDDLLDDSYIATYNDKVTAQQIFNDAK